VLLPHAQAVLSQASAGLWRIAQGLGRSGSYAAALDLFRKITAAHQHDPGYGNEHPDSLAARADVASWTGQAGDQLRPGPVRAAAAGPRVLLQSGAPRHPARPRQPGLLDPTGEARYGLEVFVSQLATASGGIGGMRQPCKVEPSCASR
jgi:hypothetical protein